MNRKTAKIFFIAYLFNLCVGFFLHSVYELSKYNRLVGLFAPINDSPWEQLKTLFFPILMFTIILYFSIKRKRKNILFVHFQSILTGMVMFISLYYTLSDAFDIHGKWFKYTIYLLSTAVIYILCIYYSKNDNFFINNFYSFQLFIVLILIFMVCTFIPPRFPLFQDPVTKSFGLIHNIATKNKA